MELYQIILIATAFALALLTLSLLIAFVTYKITFARGGRRFSQNYLKRVESFYNSYGDISEKLSEFIGHFRAVIFCPSHLSLVKDGPSVRRSFIDTAISQIQPSYVALLQKYNSILSQRNALIKNAYFQRDVFDSTVEYWSDQLAEAAERISKKRAWYTDLLSRYSDELIRDMTCEKEQLRITYRSEKTKDEYLRELMSNHEREIKYGSTLYGVHKDDLDIVLCGHEARSFASQGQQRSIALALKLSEGEISRKECGSYPVFLLDDVLSELDERRREYILSGLSDRQTFITSCNEEDFKGIDNAVTYTVKQGEFAIRN